MTAHRLCLWPATGRDPFERRQRTMTEDMVYRLVQIIRHLAACRVGRASSTDAMAQHVDAAYDEAVEMLLRMRAPQDAS